MSKKTVVMYFPKVYKESLIPTEGPEIWAQQPRLVILKITSQKPLRELGQFVPIPQKLMLDSLIFTNLLIIIARHGRFKAPVRIRNVDSRSYS